MRGSPLVDQIRARGHTATFGAVEVRLARELGFCHGVERAVDLACQARERYPGRNIYLTREIVHNPDVDRRLAALGIRRLGRDFTPTADDVVILPAFGATAAEMAALRATGCVLVDATCPSVQRVWRRVQEYAAEGRTAVIHGRRAHEEMRGITSRVRERGGHFLVVLDRQEAALVRDAIVRAPGALEPASFLERFRGACSPGFDVDRRLERIGLAHQTTMLSREALRIAEMLRTAMALRHGEAELEERFRWFDTTCGATQRLQEAALELVRGGELDLLLVVGGYDSSNTSRLAETCGERTAAFHIEGAGEILSAARIRHRPPHGEETVVTRGWLPSGPVVVGITAGASTPDRTVGEVIERLLEVQGFAVAPAPTPTHAPTRPASEQEQEQEQELPSGDPP